MNRLRCDEAFARLDDYLDRELTPEELAMVRAHLDTCSTCAGEFALEREVLDGIRAKLQRLAVSPDLVTRISERLRGG